VVPPEREVQPQLYGWAKRGISAEKKSKSLISWRRKKEKLHSFSIPSLWKREAPRGALKGPDITGRDDLWEGEKCTP